MAQRAPSRSAFDSDLGFPTDFGERYRLTEEIGSGSFGTVYAAEDKESGEVVAVKVLSSNDMPAHCVLCDACDGPMTPPRVVDFPTVVWRFPDHRAGRCSWSVNEVQ